jgi:hypothetical protein
MTTKADLDAARIALLALRAGISYSIPLQRHDVRFNSSSELLTPDAASQRLAELPKPALCEAQVRNGTLEISTSLLVLRTADFDWHSRRSRISAWNRTLIVILRPKSWLSPKTWNRIYCSGRDEAVTVPATVLDRWRRDYLVKSVNLIEDFVANPLSVARPEYVAAKKSEAAWLIVFSSPADSEERFSAEIHLD